MLHPYLVVALSILLIVFLTYKLKIHPFITLFFGALFAGLLSGQPFENVMGQLITGFGTTLGQIGWLIAFGALLGVLLEKTKATQAIVGYMLRWFGLKRAGIALNLTGFLIAIPVFCDAAFILLSGINKGLHKKTGIPLRFFATALATGLYAAHVFVPPTPGPLAAAALLNADLGWVLIGGIIMALPVALAGYFWTSYMHRGVLSKVEVPTEPEQELPKQSGGVFLPIIIPVLLIGLRSLVGTEGFPYTEGVLLDFIQIFGHPIMALCVGIGLAYLNGFKKLRSEKKLPQWISAGLAQAGVIILVTGAGGAFGNVLKGLQLADTLTQAQTTPLMALVLVFGIAAFLKTAQGSSTVAILTTAAFIAPLLATVGLDDAMGKMFAVLAIGGGALTVSHVNDSYFWVVAQFSELLPKEALKYYSTATAVQGITALFLLLLGYTLFG